MACGCIKRQKWLVEKMCKDSNSKFCQRMRAQLERMQAREKEKSK